MKKLGIVVPVKNQSEFIKTNLESLLNCPTEDLEVIIVDGGSNDGTKEICKEFVALHRNFSMVSGIDKGQSDAISIGFSKLDTKWIGWLNGDDFLLPWTLEVLLREIGMENDHKIIYGNGHFSESDGKWLRNYPTINVQEGSFSELVFEKLYLPQPSVFYKKSIYLEVGGINTTLSYVFDYELWVKFSKLISNKEVCYIPIEFSSNREYPETKTQSNYFELLNELVITQNKHFGRVSPYVVQALSDYLYSIHEARKLTHSYLRRLVYFKFMALCLNKKNPIYAAKIIFGTPLALSGSVVADRVGLPRIIKHKLCTKVNMKRIGKAQIGLPSIIKSGFSSNDPLQFLPLKSLDKSQTLDLFARIKMEDPEGLFEPHGPNWIKIEEIWNSVNDFYLLVCTKDAKIGYAILRGLDEGFEDLSLGIYIFSEFRGMGAAVKIMEKLEELARGKGVNQVRLSVKSVNHRAKRLYSKLGYKQLKLNWNDSEIWVKEFN
jgi:glycosyltransferase involved in cell wall biosynthesis/GNAT superfamily N-acetyltransferase